MPEDHPRHYREFLENSDRWDKKKILRNIYRSFYEHIAEHLVDEGKGITVELGSGIGKIKEVIPDCITTDLFLHPGVDRAENAYQLIFEDNSVTNVILFDLFHHLKYPATALSEIQRILLPHGRIIIFEPCLSLLGLFVYGIFHQEPLGLMKKIHLYAPDKWSVDDLGYYSAQGNTSRIFTGNKYLPLIENLRILSKNKYSAISYVASGGYSKPQLYPDKWYPFMKLVDKICDFAPIIFATRQLIVLEKRG